MSFLFFLLEILATTFENTLSKKTSIGKRVENVILQKLRNVNHEQTMQKGDSYKMQFASKQFWAPHTGPLT